MSATPVSGGCLCGAVRFELDPPLRDVFVCHCSLCRRAGTNAGAYTSVPRGALRIGGSDTLATHVDVNGRRRSFCGACGSTLFWAESDDRVSVSAGALEGETGLRVERHLHVGSAADWESIPRDAPWHVEGSGSPIAGDEGE